MSYDYSENILVQESAGELLQNELGWDVKLAYNTEILGQNGTFGRVEYKEILLTRYFNEALKKLHSWITEKQIEEAKEILELRLSSSSLVFFPGALLPSFFPKCSYFSPGVIPVSFFLHGSFRFCLFSFLLEGSRDAILRGRNT